MIGVLFLFSKNELIDRALYNLIVSTSPKGDADIEPFLRDALKRMLDERIKEMKTLQESLR